jgi:hypothetical protein
MEQGCQSYRQAVYIERYNILRGPEHSYISTVTNTKINIATKIAHIYLINVMLGSVVAPQENWYFVSFLECQFASQRISAHWWFFNRTLICFVSCARKHVHAYVCHQVHLSFIVLTWETQIIEILIKKLTNSMELSLSWEATKRPATQEFPSILWNPNIRYRVHKSLSLAQSWARSIQSIPFHLSKIHFNIILPPTSMSS